MNLPAETADPRPDPLPEFAPPSSTREDLPRSVFARITGKPLSALWPRLGLLAVLGLGLGLAPARAVTTAAEYDLKAAFLFNFVLFTTWPAEALPPPGEPFVIGILGTDPFGPALDRIVNGENTHGRRIVVKRFANPAEIGHCGLLYICRSEQARLPAVLDELRGRAVLTVSDIERFAYDGGIIGMVVEKDRIRVQINVDRAKEGRLTIGAKLLRIARLISETPRSMLPLEGRTFPLVAAN